MQSLVAMNREEIRQACRSRGIYAQSGREALRLLAKRMGVLRMRLTSEMRAFIKEFNRGDYPEIDDPRWRSLSVPKETEEDRATVIAAAQVVLWESECGIAERLRRAGCYGETPEEAIAKWLRIWCGDDGIEVVAGHAVWMGECYPLYEPLREFMARWDEYPWLHFAIAKQLG